MVQFPSSLCASLSQHLPFWLWSVCPVTGSSGGLRAGLWHSGSSRVCCRVSSFAVYWHLGCLGISASGFVPALAAPTPIRSLGCSAGDLLTFPCFLRVRRQLGLGPCLEVSSSLSSSLRLLQFQVSDPEVVCCGFWWSATSFWAFLSALQGDGGFVGTVHPILGWLFLLGLVPSWLAAFLTLLP